MAWYEDLAPCDYFGEEFAPHLRAVGWLEHGKAFDTGSVDPAVYRRLVELLKDPWVPCIFMGFHRCDLCVYDGDSGKRNLFVPGAGAVYSGPRNLDRQLSYSGGPRRWSR